MHAWDAVTPLEETLRFLDDSVAAGKISYYGFSNYLGLAGHQGRAHRAGARLVGTGDAAAAVQPAGP